MNARAPNLLAGSPVRLVTQYEPATRLSQAQLPSLNAVATRRLPFVAELAGKLLTITPTGLEQTLPKPEPCYHFGLGHDLERPILSLPRSLAERLVGSIQDGLGLPDEPLRSLLIELALADLLDALDTQIAIPSRVEPADAPLGDFDRLMLAIRWGDWQGPVYLHLPCSGAGAPVAAIANLLSHLREAPAAMDELPLPLGFEIGACRLSVAQLSSLRPGDVVLLQTYYPASGEILVAIARAAARATLAGRGATLCGRFGNRPAFAMEMNTTQADGAKASSADTNATLDQIEVTLTFELGRRMIDLRTLRSMAPGYIFDLGRDPEGPVDILANGKTIGTGEIVRIGETIGVRAIRLFLHD
jgi:type III secretion protein Q